MTRTFAHVGEFVGIGQPVLHLVDPSRLSLKAVIDEADALRVRLSQRALVTMDAFQGQKLEGRVAEVSPIISSARQESRTLEVKIQLDDSSIPLKSGFSGDIEIIVQEVPNVLRLPTHVILERERRKYVQVVSDGRLRERPIHVSASNWDVTEITAGLHEGDRVIIPGDRMKLDEGRLVHVVE